MQKQTLQDKLYQICVFRFFFLLSLLNPFNFLIQLYKAQKKIL